MSATAMEWIALALSLGAVLYAFLVTRQIDNKAHIQSVQSELTKLIAELRLRMDMAETHLRNVPDPTVLTELRIKMSSLETSQEALLRESHRTGAATARIEDYLLKAKP